MSTKFGNLEDFFDFLELKRAEIEESFRAQMAMEELERPQAYRLINETGDKEHTETIKNTMDIHTSIIEETIDDFIDIRDTEAHSSQSLTQYIAQSSTQSESIEMAWSTSLETPKTSRPPMIDEYDFDMKMIAESSPKWERQTDTTLIMEQMNLNEDQFDDVISAYSREFDPPSENKEIALDVSPKDPFDLLSFPMSQFPEDNSSVQEVDDTFIEDNDQLDGMDELLSEFDLIESNVTDDCDLYNLDLDIPMSQFPNTQMMSRSYLSDELNETTQKTENVHFVGFSTGRGKQLPPPSDESLKKALQIIESVDEASQPDESHQPFQTIVKPPSFGGFSTGKGTILPPPSKEAMKRARSLMDLDDLDETGDESPILPVFKTGRGKSLPPPSEEAIKRAHSLIEEEKENRFEVPDLAPIGFATAKGKILPLPSKAALDKAKNLIGADEFASTESLEVHFSTGRGTKVPRPSEEALKLAADLVKSVNFPAEQPGDFVGFSTGKGKTMPSPSEEALKRAKQLVETDAFSDVIETSNQPIVTKTKQSSVAPLPKKPFSLSTAWKRTRRPAQSHKPPPAKIKTEPVKLFDLSALGQQRYNLKEFFQQTPNLCISPSEYKFFEIGPDILKINSGNAKDFKFACGWGASEAHKSLLSCGASSVCINLAWTVNHYRWIIWKFASLIRSFPDSYSPANLSPSWVLSQLLYRYEREIHQCHRSALKKIVERDDAVGKYLCLMVSGIDWGKKCLELSDGWYSLWTATLDTPLWNLVEKSRIAEGIKIEISGASLSGQDALPILEASAVDCPCRMVIWRNSCRPSRWDTKLGFMTNPKQRAVTFLKHLSQIHPQGGPIPALSVVIDRVYPLLFREERQDPTSAIAAVQTRNERDHYLYLEMHPEQAQNSKFTSIQRIRVSNNHTRPCNAIVSFWTPLGEEQLALLQEGYAVIVTNLRASTSTRTPLSFSNCLSLVSSKSTRLFKDDLKATAPSLNNLLFDSKQFNRLKELKANEMIDLIGGIVLGKCGNYFWIGTLDFDWDESGSIDLLVCLKNFMTSVTLLPGDSINFRDISFNHFDTREGVVHFNFTEYSDFKKEPRSITSYKRSHNRFIELTK